MRSSGDSRGELGDHSHKWKMGHCPFWWQIAVPSNHTLAHVVSQGKLGSHVSLAVPATHMTRSKWLRLSHRLPAPAPQRHRAVPMGETVLSPSFTFSSTTRIFSPGVGDVGRALGVVGAWFSISEAGLSHGKISELQTPCYGL